MSYVNTFIKISDDCPVAASEIPVSREDKKPAHLIQYELLQQHPYKFDHEGLIFETFVIQKEITPETLGRDAEKIKAELFSKGHPCLRASALMKRYGFGAHYNEEGKIAIYPMESHEYQAFATDKKLKQLPGMKSKR